MLDLVYYSVLILISSVYVLGIIIYKRISILKSILFIITLLVILIWEFFPDIIPFNEFNYLEDLYYILLVTVLLVLSLSFRSKIKVTRNLTDHDFFDLEKQLESVTNTSELLRKRFIRSIELMNEGLIFYETDYSGLYITDQIKDLIDIQNNQVTMDDYVNIIYEEDRKMYLQTIKKLNEKVPSYEMKYRVQSRDTYAWVIEKGRLFKHQKMDHIIATLKPVNLKLFPDTLIEELDSLPYEEELTKTLSSLRKEKETFYLVMLHLTNIPDVNKRFGRDVGNLMIAEYVKNMRYHFAREKNTLFRITGIQFALIIKDDLKYQNLHRALTSGGDLINLKLSIGGIQQIIYPNLGIIKHDPWSKININELISLSNKALEEAISDNKNNYSIFGG
ncbi:MAG: diguanylate cyclase [Candidatus Izemoplasmatales bacterium]|uniref:Diguanylate cyclase n=1 Tax=Hujiaoplasma nucleasis TaxID=2725268 RepID=A0A7L6N5E1_9MOLU|nr:diguanylate cyclase [Hujiaoplasma nucleasis]QLY40487.1 diguanylate cyclase [Hujiaoplasma nucleasis]